MTPGVPDFPPLWVLRHGQTEWNVEGRLQGALDSPLTPMGVAQAKAQQSILKDILPADVQVRSSPSGRAWRTAEIVTEGAGFPILADPDLTEIDMGVWNGRLTAELRAELGAPPDDPHLWKFASPGGETLSAMTARVTRVLAGLSGPTVLITHGVTSRLLRCLVLGRPARELSLMPGGQGVVHYLAEGRAQQLGNQTG